MKIKKVLCLGAVLGAVLSVGMVVSASAAVNMGEFPLNSAQMTLVTGDSSNGYSGEYGGMTFTKLDDLTETYIKLNSTGTKTSTITFQVPQDCYLSVMFIAGSSSKGTLKISSDDGGFTEATLSATVGQNIPVKLLKDASSDSTDDTYTISVTNETVQISEIEFSDATKGKPVYLISDQASSGTTSGNGCIAVVKSEKDPDIEGRENDEYYAVLLVRKDHVEGNWPSIAIINTGTENKAVSGQVYEKVIIKGIEYDANEFGPPAAANYGSNYLFAVKLNDKNGVDFTQHESELIDQLEFSHAEPLPEK